MNKWICSSRPALAVFLVGLVTCISWQATAAEVAATALQKWATEIGQLTAKDGTNPPPAGGILFVGSSSIRLWTSLEQDFHGLPVIRRGFGGSELADSTYFADRIIIPYHPRIVVLYAGDNDIKHGRSPTQVAADFEDFRALLRAHLPSTRLIYIGIKPSPARADFHEKFRQANSAIAKACAKDSLCTFVDVWKAMLDAQGQPRTNLFVADGVHLNAAGYAIWRQAIWPLLLANENDQAGNKSSPEPH